MIHCEYSDSRSSATQMMTGVGSFKLPKSAEKDPLGLSVRIFSSYPIAEVMYRGVKLGIAGVCYRRGECEKGRRCGGNRQGFVVGKGGKFAAGNDSKEMTPR